MFRSLLVLLWFLIVIQGKLLCKKYHAVAFSSLCRKIGIFKNARNYLCGCFGTVLQANKIRPHRKIGQSLSLGVTASNSLISVCCLLHRNRRTRGSCTLSSSQPEMDFDDYHCQNGQGLSQLSVISNGTSATEQHWRIQWIDMYTLDRGIPVFSPLQQNEAISIE